MTIKQALDAAQETLEMCGVPDARLDTEYLLAEVLDAPRLLVLVSKEQELTDARAERFFSLVERRAAREPLQYILKSQYFMGFPFLVSPDVLIPRQDTEVLCEQALLVLSENMRVLDMCTGSGALAVALKKLMPTLDVSAADISPEALQVARQNAENNGAQVTFYQSDMFDALEHQVFDVIVSNPPYIKRGEIPSLQAEVLFEPRMALDGGEDGLTFYRILAREAGRHLTPDGAILMEIGDVQAQEASALLAPEYDVALVNDLGGRPRVIIARRKGGAAYQG